MDRLPRFDPRAALFDADLAGSHGEKGYGGILEQDHVPRSIRSKSLQARKKLNCCGLLQTILVPIALFVGTFYVMSYRMFYQSPSISILLVALAFLFVFIIGGCAFQAQRKEQMSGQRTWFFLVFCSSLLACVAGTLLGFINYSMNSRHYYDYMSLRKVVDVDPGQWQGKQLLDAGEIGFKAGSYPDRSLSSAWQKGTIYCVAPISSDGAKLGSYDFWAVGKDCCSPRQGDFGCGWSGTGLRVMDATDTQGYRLALEQAEAKYNIQARQPIFLKTGGNRDATPYMAIKKFILDANSFMLWSCIAFAVIHLGIVGWITYTTAEKARQEGWVGSGV